MFPLCFNQAVWKPCVHWPFRYWQVGFGQVGSSWSATAWNFCRCSSRLEYLVKLYTPKGSVWEGKSRLFHRNLGWWNTMNLARWYDVYPNLGFRSIQRFVLALPWDCHGWYVVWLVMLNTKMTLDGADDSKDNGRFWGFEVIPTHSKKTLGLPETNSWHLFRKRWLRVWFGMVLGICWLFFLVVYHRDQCKKTFVMPPSMIWGVQPWVQERCIISMVSIMSLRNYHESSWRWRILIQFWVT